MGDRRRRRAIFARAKQSDLFREMPRQPWHFLFFQKDRGEQEEQGKQGNDKMSTKTRKMVFYMWDRW